MSHCLNEVKSVTLINCRNNLIFIIVVCPWDEKGKISKIRQKFYFDTLMIYCWYFFSGREITGSCLGSDLGETIGQ